jgi:hypothetical protein
MTERDKLTWIKIVHTLIWVFFNFVIFYLLWAMLFDTINRWVWIGFSFIFLEGIVLLVFKNVCPVTLVARKYSKSDKANFDIYLPNWLAKYNKQIYTIIVLLIIIILIYRLLN